jgi:hypothetical protein
MFGLRRSRTERVRAALKEALSYTDELLRDERLRADVRSAVGHGVVATDRAREASGLSGLTARLAADKELRRNLRSLLDDVDSVGERVRRKTSHRLRNALIVIGGSGAILAAVPSARRWATSRLPRSSDNAPNPSLAKVESRAA